MDQPPAQPPAVTADWLRRLEVGVRIGVASIWLVASTGPAWGKSSPAGALAAVLGISALLLLGGRGPRAAALVAGASAVSLWWIGALPLGEGTVVFAGAATAGLVALYCSAAGSWLRQVWCWERRRRLALLATGLAAGSGNPTLAGDLYEYEGFARHELEACGTAPARCIGALRPSVERLARVAARVPGVRLMGPALTSYLRSRLERSLG